MLLVVFFVGRGEAQIPIWQYKEPVVTIHFGAGNVRDVNSVMPLNYDKVESDCPQDGHYTYTPYTSDCFHGDWFTLTEDHTPGDNDGNMMLVNSSYDEGLFFKTALEGLKEGTTYEFSVWIMNVCKITDKCPYPLLPNITMEVRTDGRSIAQFGTGEVARERTPAWRLYRAIFTTPSIKTPLTLTMINNAPGGCGNDFALDDITIRECIIPEWSASVAVPPKALTPKKQPIASKQPVKKPKSLSIPTKTQPEERENTKVISTITNPPVKQNRQIFPPTPKVLATRTNALIKQIEIEAGEIVLNLYDNGEIDGDTVSIYHNNVLIVSKARLSQEPLTFRIKIDAENPYHELVMVAENLGSIPPNTSVMIITAGNKRYQVFITSTEQKNAKVILNLKE